MVVYELLLDLAYIALACGLVWGVWQLRARGYFAGGLMGSLSAADPLAGGIWLLMAVVLFGLVIYAGMTPPMIFHLLLGGMPKHHPVKLADLFAIGPIGNLAQLTGAGTAVYLYFQATSLVIVVSLVVGFLSVIYHF